MIPARNLARDHFYMSLSYQDCYVLLGLAKEANWDDVRRAYRRRASVWHPDKFPSNTPEHVRANEKFVELSQAYEMLQSYHTQHSALPLDSREQDTALHLDAKEWRDKTGGTDLAMYEPYEADERPSASARPQPRTYYTPMGQFSKLLVGLMVVGGVTLAVLGSIEFLSNQNKLQYVPLAESEKLLKEQSDAFSDLDTPVITQPDFTRRLAKDLKRGVPLGQTSMSVGNSLNKQMNRYARDDY